MIMPRCCKCIVIVLLWAACMHRAHAQIFGCDDVDCPKQDAVSGPVACTFPTDGIGVTSFESDLTTAGPLTWTMRGDHRDRQAASGKIWRTYLKTFHLGTPPSLELSNCSYRGCSFLFSNVTTALQVSNGYDDWSKFGCDTALGNGCMEDVISQARDYLQNTSSLSSSLSQLTTCALIRDAMQEAKVPDSWELPDGRDTWISIADKMIAGPGGFVPLVETQDGCSITTEGYSYNVSFEMWDSIELAEPENSGQAQLWRDGITPLMIIFFSYAGDVDFLPIEPEVQMTCLKIVPFKTKNNAAGLRGSRHETVVFGTMPMMLVHLILVLVA